MPHHLIVVAGSTLLGAWMGSRVSASLLILLQLGIAAGLFGLILKENRTLQILFCSLCALCTGAASLRTLPVGPELNGWTNAQGSVIRRHDGWLVLQDPRGPIALTGVQANLGESIAVFGKGQFLVPPGKTSSWSRGQGALDSGLRTVIHVKHHVVLKGRKPSPFTGSKHQALLERVVLGRATELSEEQEDILKRTGTRHLLALSGLHVGLMSGVGALTLGGIGRLIALIWRPTGLFFLPAIGGCLFALLYANNAGFPTSTLRASCMLVLGWCCWLAGRRPEPWRLFCLALMAAVLFAPERIKTLSFGLSFSAAAGVIQALYWTKKLPASLHPVPRWFLKAMGVSVGAQLGALAWSAWVFQEFPLLAVFANLLAVPLFGFFILPAGLLGALGVPGALAITERACEFFWSLLLLLEGPVLHPAVGPTGALGLILSVLIMRKPASWLVLVLLSLGLKKTHTQGLTSTHFDVGQGDASLVELDGQKRVLIDAGPRKNQVLHALRRRGVDRLDALILSHDHRDHSAGIPAILQDIEVGCLLLPDHQASSMTTREIRQIAEEKGIPPCNRERPLPSFRTFQLRGSSLGTNNRSLVVEVNHRGRRFLYPGDLERLGEGLLLHELQPVDGLKVAHHGSRGSTSSDFLSLTTPRFCVISSGVQNPYGHPHHEVLMRLKTCEVLRTSEHGDVVIHLPERGVNVR